MKSVSRYLIVFMLIICSGIGMANSSDDFFTVDSISSVEKDSLQSAREEINENDKAENRLKLTKHAYGKRNRVALAVGMMAFLAIIMTTAQQWNPD